MDIEGGMKGLKWLTYCDWYEKPQPSHKEEQDSQQVCQPSEIHEGNKPTAVERGNPFPETLNFDPWGHIELHGTYLGQGIVSLRHL